MNARLRSLLGKKDALVKACAAITDAPEGDGEGDDRELSAEQRETFDASMAKIKTLNEDIERERELAAAALVAPGIDLDDGPSITGGEPLILKDPKHGFAHFGEFLGAVRRSGKNFAQPADERLAIVAAAPTTYGSEGVGADGGFLVAPEFGSTIFQLSLEEDAILPLTDNQEIGGNRITYPKDETTPWGTDGIRARWEAEAAAATETKPVLGFTEHKLHKLIALVPVTDELLEDATAMGSFVETGMGRSIRWKTNDAFVNGTGVGQPLGILNAPALVSVAKDTAISPDQAADTLLTSNVAAMFARMLPGSLARARWMHNMDVIPQMITLTLANQPIYTAPGGLPQAPAGMLLGRPLMPSQHCQTLGDLGDIYFVDWSQYRSVTKSGGIRTATSMHLFFDADAMAFRATFRVDGQPKLAAAVTPANGSNTLSPFVTLAERA